MGMHPILSSSNPSGKVGTELKLDCDMTARDRHIKTWTDISKHGMWGRRKSGTVESTESCTPAHLFLTTFAKDLAGDSRSPLQQFVLLRRKKKISATKVTLVKTQTKPKYNWSRKDDVTVDTWRIKHGPSTQSLISLLKRYTSLHQSWRCLFPIFS